MTKLDAHESALLLTQLAISNLRNLVDLPAQLATIRLKAAAEALRGTVDMQEYERKILGAPNASGD